MTNWSPDNVGTCPHCLTSVRFEHAISRVFGSRSVMVRNYELIDGASSFLDLFFSSCPNCSRLIVSKQPESGEVSLVWPLACSRAPLHQSVPDPLQKDYLEAANVLPISPNASAAISRRCLQTLLVLQGASKRDLYEQIQELYPTFPSYIQSFVDKIRNLGNIAAHAKQCKTTAEIVDVEPGEADWMLSLLEELFDHYYTKPAEAAAKQALVEAKMANVQRLKP